MACPWMMREALARLADAGLPLPVPPVLNTAGCDGENQVVTICGWCPGAREWSAAWARMGFAVSHGLCPACQERFELQAKGPRGL